MTKQVSTGSDARPCGQRRGKDSFAEFDPRQELSGLGRTYPPHSAEFSKSAIGQILKAAYFGEDIMGKTHRGAVFATNLQKDGQQFGVRQGG